MNCILVPDVFFDDKATLATGTVFDPTCRSARHFARAERVRAHIAKRIIEAAKNGERDPIRLHSHASTEFSIDDVSVPVVRVARDVPVPVYALIARTA